MSDYNENNDYQSDEEYEETQVRRNRIILGIVITVLIVCAVNTISKFTNSCIQTYNELVEMQEEVKREQGNIEAAMQRRIELIPDMVEVASAEAEHKERLFEEVSTASQNLSNAFLNGNFEEIGNANHEVSLAINELIIYSRKYAEIYESREFSSLMVQLESSVNRINVSRMNYNEVVTEYNKKVRKFPGMFIAKLFGFETIEPFEADEAAKEQINLVNFN